MMVRNYVVDYLPTFSFLFYLRIVGIYIAIHTVFFWILRLIMAWYTPLPGDVLGKLK